MTRLPRPTRRGWCLLGAGLTFVVGGATSGFADLIRAGIFAIVLVALAALVTFARPHRLDVTRSTTANRLQAERDYTMALRVDAARGTWTAVNLEDQHSFPGDGTARWSFDHLPSGETDVSYPVRPAHRGEYTAGPLLMELADPLGLVHARSRHGGRESWLVWPPIVDVSGTGATLPGDGDDEIISAHASQSGHAGASIREYAQGDDMRTVHWPATAHRGELMVRQFDPPAQPMTCLVVQGDVDHPGTDAGWERLLSLAASASLHFARHSVPVSVHVGERHLESAVEAVDAIAAVTTSAPAERDLPVAPTLLFHHTSARPTSPPPRHVPARAVVAGSGADDAAAALADLGWTVDVLRLDDDPAEFLTVLLESFGATR